MKILFLNAYFFPENIAFTHLEQDLIRGILADGHEIEVICPTPTRGIRPEEAKKYREIKHETMFEGKVSVTRFWAPQEGRNPIVRAFRYFWCNWRQYCLGKKAKGIDVVFAVSTPPTQGLVSGKVAKKHGCPFLYSLQDIFPDSLVTTGMTQKGSLLWKIGRKMEDSTYRGTEKIVVISKAMRQNLLDKGVPAEKVQLISNWVDTDAVYPINKAENRIFDEFGIDRSKFTVVYAGNFGASQGAQVVLEVAGLLPEVQFVIFGGGSEFETARESAKKLPNVIINGLLPQERVAEVYSLGDIAVITCKKGVGRAGLPSKTWSIMACNTPIVAAFDTDSLMKEILDEASAGICIEPENGEALANAILYAKNHQGKYCGGRKYTCANASTGVCVKEYTELFKEIVHR